MGRLFMGVVMCMCLMACNKDQQAVTAAAQSPQTTQAFTAQPSKHQPTKHKGASRTPAKPVEIHEPRDPHYEAYKAMVGVIVKLAPVHRK